MWIRALHCNEVSIPKRFSLDKVWAKFVLSLQDSLCLFVRQPL
jgi:hypothetical protein